jgi:MFS transporter, putative metabolite:H+ symporter
VTGGLLLLNGASATAFYVACAALGIGVGYWAVFVQVAAEQFGTDLRATVTTAAPNLVRGSVLAFVPAYLWLGPRLGHAPAAVLLMAVTLAVALAAAWRLRETYGVDLDYTESAAAIPGSAASNPRPGSTTRAALAPRPPASKAVQPR